MLRWGLGALVPTFKSIVCGGATRELFPLPHSAGATATLPAVGKIFAVATTTAKLKITREIAAGTTVTGAGAMTMRSCGSNATNETLLPVLARTRRPGEVSNDCYGGDLPPYDQAIPKEYILTSKAVRAVIRSWSIGPYNPPGTDAEDWLRRM